MRIASADDPGQTRFGTRQDYSVVVITRICRVFLVSFLVLFAWINSPIFYVGVELVMGNSFRPAYLDVS